LERAHEALVQAWWRHEHAERERALVLGRGGVPVARRDEQDRARGQLELLDLVDPVARFAGVRRRRKPGRGELGVGSQRPGLEGEAVLEALVAVGLMDGERL